MVVIRRVGVARDELPAHRALDAAIKNDAVRAQFLKPDTNKTAEHVGGELGLVAFGVKRAARAHDLEFGGDGVGHAVGHLPFTDFGTQSGQPDVRGCLFDRGGHNRGVFRLDGGVHGGGDRVTPAGDLRHPGRRDLQFGDVFGRVGFDDAEPVSQATIRAWYEVCHTIYAFLFPGFPGLVSFIPIPTFSGQGIWFYHQWPK